MIKSGSRLVLVLLISGLLLIAILVVILFNASRNIANDMETYLNSKLTQFQKSLPDSLKMDFSNFNCNGLLDYTCHSDWIRFDSGPMYFKITNIQLDNNISGTRRIDQSLNADISYFLNDKDDFDEHRIDKSILSALPYKLSSTSFVSIGKESDVVDFQANLNIVSGISSMNFNLDFSAYPTQQYTASSIIQDFKTISSDISYFDKIPFVLNSFTFKDEVSDSIVGIINRSDMSDANKLDHSHNIAGIGFLISNLLQSELSKFIVDKDSLVNLDSYIQSILIGTNRGLFSVDIVKNGEVKPATFAELDASISDLISKYSIKINYKNQDQENK